MKTLMYPHKFTLITIANHQQGITDLASTFIVCSRRVEGMLDLQARKWNIHLTARAKVRFPKNKEFILHLFPIFTHCKR
jgi:hypothetical protein